MNPKGSLLYSQEHVTCPYPHKLPFIFSGEICDKHLQCLPSLWSECWEILRYGQHVGKCCDMVSMLGNVAIWWACWLFLLGALARLRKATLSLVMSVCLSSWNNSAATWRIFIKFDTWIFFRKSVEKIQVSLKSDDNKGTLCEGRYTCMIATRVISVRIINVSGES
jgi:hypothetical protein